MIMYASRTGTKRNLKVLRDAGWRLLISATGVWRTEGFKYCLDNGAWTAYQQGRRFDNEKFAGVVKKFGVDADFTMAPDIVGGGMESLSMSLWWLPELLTLTPRVLIPVQDGMRERDIRPHLSERVGIAIGGTTDWKEYSMRNWGRLSMETGSYLHVLRVNSIRRIRLCQDAGAHSCDGTSVTRFAKTLPRLDNANRQQHLWGER